MSSISSIYAQNMSKLYETASTKASSSSSTSDTSNTSAKYGQDSLTISSDGLSMLEQLLSAKESDSEESSTYGKQSDHNDILSQLKDLASSDKLSDDTKSSLSDIISEIEEKLSSLTGGSEASNQAQMMPPPPPQDGEVPPPPPQNGELPPPPKASSDTAFSDTDSTGSDSAGTSSTLGTGTTNTINTTENDEEDYSLNLEAMVSSGLISQAQSDVIKDAFDMLKI